MTTDPKSKTTRQRMFRHDTTGVAALEFAMVAPLLIFLYLGSVDLCLGVTIHRKVLHAASAMNDIVTRANSFTKSDLDGIFNLGDATVAPRASGLATAKISSIKIDASGNALIAWSRARNIAADTAGSSVVLPSNLSGLRSTNLIRTSVSYNYAPVAIGYAMTGPIAMKKDVYGAPRTGTAVSCSDC